MPTLYAFATGNYTWPDNVCQTMPDEQPVRTDHMLIAIVLDTGLELQDEMPRPNLGWRTGRRCGKR